MKISRVTGDVLRSVQAGRGIAALLVVLYHASLKIFAAQKYWNVNIFHGVFNFGHAGVEFFFVLSGFIVAHVHAKDVGRSSRLGGYAQRRFVRVYPILWLVMTGVLVLSILPLGFDSAGKLSASRLVSSYLLVGPDSHATMMAVAWTLFHEVAFYFVFGLWIISPRLGAAATVLWVAAIGAASFGVHVTPEYLGKPINLLFPMGVGAWWVAANRPDLLPRWLPLASAAAFVALGIEDVYGETLSDNSLHMTFGLASAMLLASIVAAERRAPIAVPSSLMVLGAASYSIYLTHFPVLGALAQVFSHGWLRRLLPGELAFVVVVTLVVGIGVAFHYLIEKRLIDYVKVIFRTRVPNTA